MSLTLLRRGTQTFGSQRRYTTPTQISGLVGWWDASQEAYANAAAVSSLTDRSGSGRTASQATAGFRPTFRTGQINGLPAVEFDGVDDRLTTSTAQWVNASTGDWTAFCVARIDNAASQAIIVDQDGASGTARVAQYIRTGTAGQLQAGAFNTASGNTFTGNGGIASGIWHLMEIRRSPLLLEAFVDGISDGTTATTGTPRTTTGPLAIGSRVTGVNFTKGMIAEVLFFNRALAAHERRWVERYLMQKYGLMDGGVVTAAGFASAPTVNVVTLPQNTHGTFEVAWQQDNVLTVGGSQFATWINPSLHALISKRTVGSSTWDTPLNLSTMVGGVYGDIQSADNHRGFSLGADLDGRIHIVGDEHNDALRYMRTSTPGDLTTVVSASMIGTEEDSVTYPVFFNFGDGKLGFCYRNGESGGGDMFMNKYTEGVGWARVGKIIDGIGTGRSPYPQRVAVDRITHVGRIHLFWCWRDSASGTASNSRILYAYTDDDGATWKDAFGNTVSDPIGYGTTNATVIYTPLGPGLLNAGGACVDLDGYPHAAIPFTDLAGQSQCMHMWFDGTRWHFDQITTFHGTAEFGFNRPSIACFPDGTMWVVFGYQSKLRFIDVTDPTRPLFGVILDQGTRGEPTFDTRRLEDAGEFHTLLGLTAGSSSENYPARVVEVTPA